MLFVQDELNRADIFILNGTITTSGPGPKQTPAADAGDRKRGGGGFLQRSAGDKQNSAQAAPRLPEATDPTPETRP